MHYFLFLVIWNNVVQVPGRFDTKTECEAVGKEIISEFREKHGIGFFECWKGGKNDGR